MGLFEEVVAGDVDYQLAVLLYQLVGIADVAYDQQYQAGVGGVDRGLPAKGHHVGAFHVAGCH